MNRTLALQLVSDLKDELPIPSETCPAINHVQSVIRSVMRSDSISREDRNSLRNVSFILEDLRDDNNTLRELGKEWHKLATDLAHQFKETK